MFLRPESYGLVLLYLLPTDGLPTQQESLTVTPVACLRRNRESADRVFRSSFFMRFRLGNPIRPSSSTRCEWGHDDYSLRVENLPKAPPEPGQQSLFGEEEK